MHSYLRAIGFSKIKNNNDQNQLITSAICNSTHRQEIKTGADTTLAQINYEITDQIGITIIGEYSSDDILNIDHIFPYCIGTHTTEQPEIQIEAHSDKEYYSGISDDYNLGITLIYAVQNIVDYVKSNWSNTYYRVPNQVKFAGLSLNGRILYGVHLDYDAFPHEKHPISNNERRELIAKARSGDADAMENLTLDDMDTYSLISKRIKDEDLYTIVETYFMPYGINNEEYSVLGIIKKSTQIVNEISGEMLYNLTVDCNDILIDIVINALDLQGEPKVGRRFKGVIWLQGQIEFL